MATMKKKRQRKTMEIKRVLGVSLTFARKIAREIIDHNYNLTKTNLQNHPELSNVTVRKSDCSCCDSHFRAETKRGVLEIDKLGIWHYSPKNETK